MAQVTELMSIVAMIPRLAQIHVARPKEQQLWKAQVKLALAACGLASHIDGTTKRPSKFTCILRAMYVDAQ